MDARRIDLLQQMPLFGGMSAATLDLLAGDAQPVDLPAGGYFFREGEAGEHLYVLESGRVAARGPAHMANSCCANWGPATASARWR